MLHSESEVSRSVAMAPTAAVQAATASAYQLAPLMPATSKSHSAKRLIRADKMASVTSQVGLGAEVLISMAAFKPRSGDLVAVKVLSENPGYDRLELTSGRMARLSIGDVFIGVLGARRALKGYVGDVPSELTVGDELSILNLGGVVGRCSGFNQAMGQPVRIEFLGAVLHDGQICNLADYALPLIDPPADCPPVILVSGSCMHAGKTRVAVELVRRFTAAGYQVAAGKVSGVACLKDTLEMRDNGASRTLSFADFGLPSTVGIADLGAVAKSIVGHLAASSPDVIVIELGDGLLGGYNVSSVLDNTHIRDAMEAMVFCAGDFVSAWGGVELLKKYGLKPDVISGAVTDSRMGIEFIRSELGIPAANAMVGGTALFALVQAKLLAAKEAS